MATQTNPNSLANLRPISADPARASAQAKQTGFGSPGMARCTKIKRNGEQCKKVAAYGTPKCTTHGARRYKIAPVDPDRQARNQAFKLSITQSIKAPPDLRKTPQWAASYQTGDMRTGTRLRASLVAAWDAMQQGDFRQWRQALRAINN